MRLFLIPLTTKRAFIYAHRTGPVNPDVKPSRLDDAITKASKMWLQWEKADEGWKKMLTDNGNKLFRRINYEEWALKSIPAFKKQHPPTDTVEVIYPPSVLNEAEIPRIIETLGTQRQGLHRQRMIWSLIGAPLTAPFGIIPIVPNIPFFYLAFRAYSHWKALRGGEHLAYRVKNNLIKPSPHEELDRIYETPLEKIQGSCEVDTLSSITQEIMLLQNSHAKEVAEVLQVPQLVVEIERACEQIALEMDEEKSKASAKVTDNEKREVEATVVEVDKEENRK